MRILLLQLRRIGDLVLTTPVIRCLREDFPTAQIDLVVEGGSAGVLPCIDHDASYRLQRGKADLATWLRLARSRFRSPYDFCLDLTCNDRSAVAAALSGAKRKIIFSKWKSKPLRQQVYTDFAAADVARMHTADYNTAILAPLGLQRASIPSQLQIPGDSRESVRRILASQGIRSPYAIIHPGTVKAEKYWFPDRWAEIIVQIQSSGYQIIITGSPAVEEARHIAEITRCLAARAESASVCNLAGQMSLAQLAASIESAALVAGVDSAPLHFADALQCPVLGLFGPTCPHQWRPRYPLSVVVTPLGTVPPGPEYYPGLPMERLSADLVGSAWQELKHNLSSRDAVG